MPRKKKTESEDDIEESSLEKSEMEDEKANENEEEIEIPNEIETKAESEVKETDLDEKKKKLLEPELEEVSDKSSLKKTSEKDELRKKLLEKAKELKEKMDVTSSEELKEKVKDKKKKGTELLPLDDYVKSGIYIGTKVVTPKMKQFVYRRRADGLAIFNTDIIDEKLKEAIDYLSQFSPEEIIVVCKREAGWNAIELFSKFTGIKAFTKKYPAGILTNTQLENFFEVELVVITDSWLDKNALNDAMNINKKTLLVCDTNNFPPQIEHIIIGNNKSAKSLGLIYYLLAKGYCEKRGIDSSGMPGIDVWMEEKV